MSGQYERITKSKHYVPERSLDQISSLKVAMSEQIRVILIKWIEVHKTKHVANTPTRREKRNMSKIGKCCNIECALSQQIQQIKRKLSS